MHMNALFPPMAANWGSAQPPQCRCGLSGAPLHPATANEVWFEVVNAINGDHLVDLAALHRRSDLRHWVQAVARTATSARERSFSKVTLTYRATVPPGYRSIRTASGRSSLV